MYHADLKPDNILYVKDDPYPFRLVDIGSFRTLSNDYEDMLINPNIAIRPDAKVNVFEDAETNEKFKQLFNIPALDRCTLLNNHLRFVYSVVVLIKDLIKGNTLDNSLLSDYLDGFLPPMKRAVNELFDKQERLEKTGYLANTADVVSLYSLDGETVEGLFSAFYPSPRIIETELRLSAEMHVVFEHYCSIHGTPEVKPLSIDPKHDIRLFVRQVPQRLCLEPHDETSADKFPFEDLGRGYLDHYWYYGDDYFDDGLRISVDNRDASLPVVEYFQSELIHKNRLSGFVMLSDVLFSLGGLMDRLDGAAMPDCTSRRAKRPTPIRSPSR